MKPFIRAIGIQNFKSYSKYQLCNFSSISFLVGKNGAGKSSFVQAAQFIFKYIKNPKEYHNEEIEQYPRIKNDKIIYEDFFSDNFTHIAQFIGDISKPLIIDLIIDFGFKNNNIYINPLKYRFVFNVRNISDEHFLFLNEFKIFNSNNNDLLFTNNFNQENDYSNIEITKEGSIFLLESFFQYINTQDLLISKEIPLVFLQDLNKEINKEKNELKSVFSPLEKQLFYEIDDIEISSSIDRLTVEQGFGPNKFLPKVDLFNDEITNCFTNCSNELKYILNHSYQEIKKNFLENSKKLQEIESIKISEISSRKRSLEEDDVYLKCFYKKENINNKFLKNNLNRFKFKGEPCKIRISKDDKKYKVVLDNQNKINLIDEGSGYWTLTYLIMMLGNKINENKIILIEEPETYLHPNFQADLADLFIEATELLGVQIVIETHSEYLIKRVQRRIAQTYGKDRPKNKIIKDDETFLFNLYSSDVSINYIHDETNSNDIVSIQVDNNGELDRPFPPDFMDVSLNEDLLTFKLKNLN
jgi:predicted ATP-dependent endonuclease of OLD family